MFEENLQACQVFSACQTQSIRGMDGRFCGLDYARVDAYLRMKETGNATDIIDRLQIIEQAILNELADERERETGRGPEG